VDVIPVEVNRPKAATLGCGYWIPINVEELEMRGIEPDITTGRDNQYQR